MNETPSPIPAGPRLPLAKPDAWWMTFQELRSPEEFAAVFHREFPQGASEWDDRLSRRRFLQLMSASIAFAGLTGCRMPQQKIVPYTDQPEKVIPGNSLHFATTLQINGSPRGVVVTQHEGRPTHLAGNPLHPLSHGSNDIWTGAAILELYDPDRLQTVQVDGGDTTWDAFAQRAVELQNELGQSAGAGFCLLTGAVNSPTLLGQIGQLLTQYPQAKWYVYEPLVGNDSGADDGTPVLTAIDLAQADVIFALESDFLFDRPDSLALTRAFSQRRRTDEVSQCNRLYVAESCPTITGAKADHRFPVPPGEFTDFARALVDAVQNGTAPKDPRWPWLSALVNDLRQHAGRCVLVGGIALPVEARQALASANQALGNVGKTITYRAAAPAPVPVAPAAQNSAPATMLAATIAAQPPTTPGNAASTPVEKTPVSPAAPPTANVVAPPPAVIAPTPLGLGDLIARLRHGEATTLFILGGNPVYDAPTDYDFAALLGKVPATIHHTLYANETSASCQWVLNAAHDLEAWGDARGMEGTLSLGQPLIAPLYDGRSALEVISMLLQPPGIPGYDLVRGTWSNAMNTPPDIFDTAWHTWLRNGVIALPLGVQAPANAGGAVAVSPSVAPLLASKPATGPILLTFRPSASLWDGRHANSGWLQELADPVTKLTWDNAALFSPDTANKLEVTDGDVVKVTANGATLEVPVLIAPGHADHCITLPLGYGRTRAGEVGNGVGFNAYRLRRSDALWQTPATDVERTGRTHELARTQEHFRVQGRDLLHVSRLDELPPIPVPEPAEPAMPSLYYKVDYHGHAWAMTVDLNTCIGCNACIIACQSENNIPVVGKQQVLFGREMQWIRVDRYYQGPAENPRMHFQPVPCMQCENAPCEVVCPVAATQHDDEGLNLMVYNRCVGTRYCSNNCPYKVRRFNFLEYNAGIPESRRLGLNPNVTVRSRGVMEKCTYCQQRIEEARISARREHRPLRGTDITTACQDACPAEAIVFGDLSDPDSVVSKNRKKPGHYEMLGELDTRPRTTYLEKRINPNPALEPPGRLAPANEGDL